MCVLVLFLVIVNLSTSLSLSLISSASTSSIYMNGISSEGGGSCEWGEKAPDI